MSEDESSEEGHILKGDELKDYLLNELSEDEE